MNNNNNKDSKLTHGEKSAISILDAVSPKSVHGLIPYQETNDLLDDTCKIVENAQRIAYAAVDVTLVQRNWLIGKRIAAAFIHENGHADYGKRISMNLSKIR